MDTDRLVFVDCEARGASSFSGVMTEFAAGYYRTRDTFHGRLHEGSPDPANPAVPLPGKRIASDLEVATRLSGWIAQRLGGARPVFVSDNPAYDWQWVAAMYDRAGIANPFGHSGRRIGDFWAGVTRDWRNTQQWKQFRVTRHDHNPVNDVLGNMEAFAQILDRMETGMI
jgi:hypothetical protein